MSLPAAVRRAVLERQGGRCAMGAACELAMDGWGVHLEALARLAKRGAVKGLRGQAAVQYDHITPQCDAWLEHGQPVVRREGVTMAVHDARNIQALCTGCHAAKTDGERPGWRDPTPSALAHVIKPRGVWRGADKAERLRAGAPTKNYRVL
jgi:hypothetical protein